MQAPADPVPDGADRPAETTGATVRANGTGDRTTSGRDSGRRTGASGPAERPVGTANRRARAADQIVAELYREHWDGLVRLAWLMISDRAIAEEIVADALVAVHRRWRRLDAAQNIPAYLRRSVINGCRSWGRRRVLERAHLARESAALSLAPDAPSAEAEVIDRIRRDSLLQALGALPRRQREVLVLRYYLDLSERQIADTLQIATGSVKAHAHRGLAALRSKLPEHPTMEQP